MNELREGQRVQLSQAAPRHRREVFAQCGYATVRGFAGNRAFVEFDDGNHGYFLAGELEPAVEQIGMFGEVQP